MKIAEAEALIDRQIEREIDRPVPFEVKSFAAELAKRYGAGVSAILFYGSCLRSGELDGVLDFYVLADSYHGFTDGVLLRWGARWLPPNVFFTRGHGGERALQAKVAVMTTADFARAVGAHALDTTIWARFSQPVALVWSRDAEARFKVARLLRDAVVSAARVGAPLLPSHLTAAEFWSGVYAATYGAELRAERNNRPQAIVDPDPERYSMLALPALIAAGYTASNQDDALAIEISASARQQAARRWRRERRRGKVRNVARLLKAVFTFEGAIDYADWKLQRHAGVGLNLTDWQRRHPILAAPAVLWRLYKNGALR